MISEARTSLRARAAAPEGGAPADAPAHRPWATVTVVADGRSFRARVRPDTAREADYYRHGGIMRFVVRNLLGAAQESPAP